MKNLLLLLFMLISPTVLADQITATTWLVADGEGRIIESVNADQQRSIASITKLMTAMVVLDAKQELDQKISGFTRRELIQLAIVKSNNRAADLLCNNYPGGRDRCVVVMNEKAAELGLKETTYADPTGLNPANMSTANELVKIVIEASKYPEIVEASRTLQGKIKRNHRWIRFNNTNPLVNKHDFIVSKTGYIRRSGGCIVMMLNTDVGQRIVVLLNSKNTRTRIPEAINLAVAY